MNVIKKIKDYILTNYKWIICFLCLILFLEVSEEPSLEPQPAKANTSIKVTTKAMIFLMFFMMIFSLKFIVWTV